MWVLLLILTQVQNLQINDRWPSGYTVRVYDDSTYYVAFVDMGSSYNSPVSVHIYKCISTRVVDSTVVDTIYGPLSGLSMDFVHDSLYLSYSGGSGYLHLAVRSLDLSGGYNVVLSDSLGEILSSKALFFSRNNELIGYIAYSFVKSGIDSLVVLKTQQDPRFVEAKVGFQKDHPIFVSDLQYNFMNDSLLLYLLLELSTDTFGLYRAYLGIFTDNFNTGTFGIADSDWYMPLTDTLWVYATNVAVCSNYVHVYGRVVSYVDSSDSSYYVVGPSIISRNTNFGRGKWMGPDPLNPTSAWLFFSRGFSIGDTVYFPIIYVWQDYVKFRIFKYLSGDTTYLPTGATQISSGNNFSHTGEGAESSYFSYVLYGHDGRINLVRPVFDYSPSKATFVAVWHHDDWYIHPVTHILHYQGSRLWAYFYMNTGVREEEELDFDVKWDARRKTLLLSASFGGNYHVDVRDILGRLITSQKVEGNREVKLDLLRRGIYFVTVKGGNGAKKTVKILNF